MARRKRMKQTRRAEDDDEKAPLPLPEAEVEDFRSKIQDRSERWAEEYSEVVDELPLELQRTFVLMKELDDRSEHMKGNIHETWQQYCTARSQDASDDAVAASSRTSQLREIRDHTQKAVSLSEEKLALALSAYEVVDRQIRRLDMDLLKTEKSLCAALRQEMTDALQPSSSNRVHVPVPKETDRFSPEGQLLTFWSGLISLDPLTCLAYLREFLQSDTPAPDAGKKKRKTSEKRSETPSNLGPTASQHTVIATMSPTERTRADSPRSIARALMPRVYYMP
ncbi:hypothetical protein MCAP1_002827 [Malassezia caprae]|uniref:Inhibitor of growth protein N-terminal histone-binding domain-containing protein n=1 Tax=Malassezia caprae TaxID=1381934 RepID=A0AAF0E811_9BASI|nr:hypothetical protein MCAP1_002827 [Malassezia caprae]